ESGRTGRPPPRDVGRELLWSGCWQCVYDFALRFHQLDWLGRGLAREAQLFSVGSKVGDPLVYLEREAYRKAIRAALAGVEAARVVLAKVIHRLKGRPLLLDPLQADGAARAAARVRGDPDP